MATVIAASEKIGEYLASSEIIDYHSDSVRKVVKELSQNCENEISFAEKSFEFVRDKFPHTFDIGAKEVACTVSDVIKYGHGLCYAKSHLLVAILRCAGIPSGLCYQKLIFSDDIADIVLHGLTAVYIKSINKWIRLDARGNKKGVNAQFSLKEEALAFPVREELGEKDGLIIYAEPDKNVIFSLRRYEFADKLKFNLPKRLYCEEG